MTQYRRWVCDATFNECITSNNKLVVGSDRKQLFLFNDYFLFSKSVGTVRDPKYEVEFHMPLLSSDGRPQVKFEGDNLV